MTRSPTSPVAAPKNLIVVLLDSLGRHMLGAYGSDEFDTPNLDRFAAQSVRFDQHHAGSLPCMPARHDILVGALDFLWRPWGSIEVWERAITHELRHAGVTTMLVSDHPHLFETGGENYHTDFGAWDYLRGHEGDPWRLVPDPSAVGAPSIPDARPAEPPRAYDTARSYFRQEADFPGPRTMQAASDWIERNVHAHDRFMLFVDEFDPHEPFDTPEPYASMYDDTWEGPKLIWPPYAVGALAKGRLTGDEARQIRACYGAKLTMIDHWFGRLLDTIDAQHLATDTAVVVCTDHGHYLGEPDDAGRDLWGKPMTPVFNTLGHTPLLIRWPGREPGVVEALTTNVDLHATIADVFAVEVPHRTHGTSLVPLLTGEQASIRDWVLAGYWGHWVNVVGDGVKYVRSHVGAQNLPLSMWSNRWSTMPIRVLDLPPPDHRAVLDHMPGSTVPVIRQPFEEGDMLPYWAFGARGDDHHLFDLGHDPEEDHNLVGVADGLERDALERLHAALLAVEAPDDQFQRLGLG